jgi:nicotinamide-nucleotide amidase
MARDRSPLVGITVSGAIISARVRATGSAEQMRAWVEADLAEIERRWHPYVFGRDDETLSQSLGSILKARRAALATAESCTGGWLGKSIVDVAGSSEYYLGGWVTYSNEMKSQCLGVDPEVIKKHGAVSAQVGQLMAQGARERSGAEYALSVTGVAGPEGSPGKPAGLVYIALAQPARPTSIRRFEFTGDRSAVRERSVLAAMQTLRFALLEVDEDVPLLWETKREGAIGRI